MGFRVNSAGRVNQGHFAQVPNRLNAPRSAFDRSFSHKTTVDAGLIYPVLWKPLLPGDTVNLTMNALARLATPIFPYMDNLYMDVHFFFVPNRLLWDNWERFQGAQDDPGDSTDYEVPSLSQVTHAAGFASGSIYDYFGLPTLESFASQDDMPIALPLRAYNLIWNTWYRDENLQNSVPVLRTDAFDTTSYTLLRRNRRKDYFTSATPWPQKGPAVTLPLGSSAPVVFDRTLAPTTPSLPPKYFDRLLERVDPALFEAVKKKRVEGLDFFTDPDSTDSRLATRERVKSALIKNTLKRSLE